MIFIHPDGTGVNHFSLGRMYWLGPDAVSEWDRLPETAVYRGHNSDQLTSTSNGGATAHAFGVKVQGPDSFGTDRGRRIRALSGFAGSLLREAACKGHPVGVVNDGDINGEPGTGAFLAETANRGQAADQAVQLVAGRPGADCDPTRPGIQSDPEPIVMLGGGERFFLPKTAPLCRDLVPPPPADGLPLSCAAHTDPVDGRGPARNDGRNLLEEAADRGYRILRTRAGFDRLMAELKRRPEFAPKVLGLFAADDTFNDAPEARIIAAGLLRNPRDPLPPEQRGMPIDKVGRLVLWGAAYGDARRPYSFHPPTAAEMAEMALLILERRSRLREKKPFALVVEVESTDNMANANNAVGTLRAIRRADTVIGVARRFEAGRGSWAGHATTGLVLTAADSDASGMQALALRRTARESPYNPVTCSAPAGETDRRNTCTDPAAPAAVVTHTIVNPSASGAVQVPVDGIEGAGSRPFLAEPDALSAARSDPESDAYRRFGDFDNSGRGSYGGGTVRDARLPFAVVWSGVPDVSGGILSRAQGLNADVLHRPDGFLPGEPPFTERFDNTDIYRMLYLTLFGVRLPSGVGSVATDR